MDQVVQAVDRALDTPREWLFTSRVVAKWHDGNFGEQTLGHDLGHNQGRALFTLMLGRSRTDPDDHLLLFHLAIRVQASTTTRPYHLLYVIPIDFFDSVGPMTMHNADGRKANDDDVARVQLHLCSPGFVLMPSIKPASPVTGTPRDLLLGLHSLSKSLCIDLLLDADVGNAKASASALHKFNDGIRNGSYRTSPLKFRDMYGGKRAKRNDWDAFRLDGQEAVGQPPSYNDDHVAKGELEKIDAAIDDDKDGEECPYGYPVHDGTPTQLFSTLEDPMPSVRTDTPSSNIQVRQSSSLSAESATPPPADAGIPETPFPFPVSGPIVYPDTQSSSWKSRQTLPQFHSSPPVVQGAAPAITIDGDKSETSSLESSTEFHSSPPILQGATPTNRATSEPNFPNSPPNKRPRLASSGRLSPNVPFYTSDWAPRQTRRLYDATATDIPEGIHAVRKLTFGTTLTEPWHDDVTFLDLMCFIERLQQIAPTAHIQLGAALRGVGFLVKRGQLSRYHNAKGRCMTWLLMRERVERKAFAPPPPPLPERWFREDLAQTIAWASEVAVGAEWVLFEGVREMGDRARAADKYIYPVVKAYFMATVFCFAGAEGDVQAVLGLEL